MQLTIANFDAVPLFNQDVQDQGIPAAVTQFAEEIRAADALLIATPEYNFSISGVLKNAIDWLTRVPVQPFKDKPVALLSATGGPVGGARHQYELRKILGSQDALVLTRPEVFINLAHTKFDAEGKLTDEPTRKILTDQMLAFERWIVRMRQVL
jgi:chromate reductase